MLITDRERRFYAIIEHNVYKHFNSSSGSIKLLSTISSMLFGILRFVLTQIVFKRFQHLYSDFITMVYLLTEFDRYFNALYKKVFDTMYGCQKNCVMVSSVYFSSYVVVKLSFVKRKVNDKCAAGW